MKGMTMQEVMQYADQRMQAALQAAPQPAPAPGPAPAPAPAPQPVGPQPPDPQMFYENPQEYQRQWNEYQMFQTNQAIQQASQPFLQSQVEIARNASRMNDNLSDVWQRYSHEIDQEMVKLPLEHRANPRAWETAATLVAGRHRRELVDSPVQRDAGTIQTGGAVPPGAGPAGPIGDELDQLFQEDHPAIQRFKQNGMNAQRVRAHAAAMGHTPEKYAEMLKRKATVHA